MNQPLGRMAGNLCEVHEAIAALTGRGPPDLWQCTRELASELLALTGLAVNREAARQMLDDQITSGRAMAKFKEMVTAQGGQLDRLPSLGQSFEIVLDRSGHVTAINTEQLGIAIIELGGGRKQVDDAIDHSVGLEMLVRLGDRAEAGKAIVRVFASRDKFDQVQGLIAGAISISHESVSPPPLIRDRLAAG
jgi:thymidine phosphorylase